jgi:hypothetical protein
MSRMPDDRNGVPGRDASESRRSRRADHRSPRDELDLGEIIEAEVGRAVRHPRAGIAHLKRVAAHGEHGSAPFVEFAVVTRWIVPLYSSWFASRCSTISRSEPSNRIQQPLARRRGGRTARRGCAPVAIAFERIRRLSRAARCVCLSVPSRCEELRRAWSSWL